MNDNMTKSKHLDNIKELIFMTILNIGSVAFALIAFINLLNKRPIENFLLPLIASGIIFMMVKIYKKNKYQTIIKNVFLIFLCIFYLPLAWLTSPGSYSAMSFYAVLILLIGIILARKIWEYSFPLMVIIETVVLLNYEPLKPLQYMLYSEPKVRALDLSINFTVVGIVIFLILVTVNNYFDKEHHKIFLISITDQLTGLYNRRYLFDILKTFHEDARKETKSFTLLMMDLSRFKQVNDTYGHAEGDNVLKIFGEILLNASRNDDVPVRYGGDEFVLVLPKTTAEGAKLVEYRILELFKPIMERYSDCGLSIGFGIAESGDLEIEDIIKLADDHLYKNKKNTFYT